MPTWVWHAKPRDSYVMGSIEADDNACLAASMLMIDYGWTLEACCGMFGSINYEGGWNPWRWQDDNIRSVSQAQTTSAGYGLIGWTPAKKYLFNNATFEYQGHTYQYFPNYNQEGYPGYGPNFSDRTGLPTDGAAQIKLIGEGMQASNTSIWYDRKGCSARNYIHLTDVTRAAYYWGYNAEYSAHIDESIRGRENAARAWHQHMIDMGFEPSPGSNMPIWLMAKVSQSFLNKN